MRRLFSGRCFCGDEPFQDAVCASGRCARGIYSAYSDIWGFYRLCCRSVPHFDGRSVAGIVFVIMFLVLQQIEGNLIYPKVVGNSVGLPSIWVLAAVTIGGSLMGVVGMLIFIPLVSVVYTLFRESVYKRLEQKQR